MSNKARISSQDKQRIADRINYFRTLPLDLRKMAANLEPGSRSLRAEFVTYEERSIVVAGRVMILSCS